MDEWHHGSPEEPGEQQPPAGHSPCSGKPHLKHSSHRDYNSAEVIPWKTILELPICPLLSSCAVHLCLTRPMVYCWWAEVQPAPCDCPGWELAEHSPAQPTHTPSTSGTRICMDTFTQLNWSTLPGCGPQFVPKSPFPVEKVPFLLNPPCLLL